MYGVQVGILPGEESRPEVIVRQPVFAFGDYEEESNLARVGLIYPRVERVRRGRGRIEKFRLRGGRRRARRRGRTRAKMRRRIGARSPRTPPRPPRPARGCKGSDGACRRFRQTRVARRDGAVENGEGEVGGASSSADRRKSRRSIVP